MREKFDCKGKLVLITGASSGIGMETAHAFARKQGIVALTGRASDVLEDMTIKITNDGGNADYFPFDLLNVAEIPSLLRQIEEHFGKTIDILVNNAAAGVCGFVEDIPVGEHYQTFQINYFASLALCHAVIPAMKAKRSGQIINISSGVAKRGVPLLSAICTSKSALNALTESLRVELASYNIDVILISPGLVDTKFNKRLRVYGTKADQFNIGKLATPFRISERIVDASIHRRREVTISIKTRFAHHFIYWFPNILDAILEKKLKRGVEK